MRLYEKKTSEFFPDYYEQITTPCGFRQEEFHGFSYVKHKNHYVPAKLTKQQNVQSSSTELCANFKNSGTCGIRKKDLYKTCDKGGANRHPGTYSEQSWQRSTR